jgi:signal transduction histidine kinase
VRSSLRWRILLFTVVPLVGLVLATLWVVNRNVSQQVHRNLELDLRRAAAVFEDMLHERAEQLRVASRVIVRDPRFFSVLTLPGSHADPAYRNTVAGVARDFNTIAHADLLVVLDEYGKPVASVGSENAPRVQETDFVRKALHGTATSGIVVAQPLHFQGTATPVIAGGRVVGVLVLGASIGQDLAAKLRDLTRSQVSFVSGGALSGSTLTSEADRHALVTFLTTPGPAVPGVHDATGLLEIRGGRDTYVSLVRPIPGSLPEQEQTYAIQRSLEAETAFLRRIQDGLAQLGLLAILAALIAGILVSQRITTPINKIVHAAAEIERGNYDSPLKITSKDEIGYLAQRFEEMRAHERAYVRSLQEVARIKSEFISVASHELRTPISVIHGFQELLAEGALGALTEKQRRAVQAIGEGTAQLVRIADDATRIAQIEGERLVLSVDDYDISNLLKTAVHSATAEARGRRVSVTLETDRSIPRLRLDGPRLTEAIANLVRNGIRFTPDGGRVEVRAAWRAGELSIEVADTGIGIATEYQDKLFEKGFVLRDSLNHHSSNTLEFKSAGLGLGLSIARGIVEAHGGTICVESQPGEGSVFTIRLKPERVMELMEAA